MAAAFRLLSFLPLPFLHLIGALVGLLVYLASPTYRRNLRANLAQAVGPVAASRLRWQVAREAGKAVFELPPVWLRSLAHMQGLVVDVRGFEVAEALAAEGRGLIFLTPHQGCFEITAQWISTRLPITVLYRTPKQSWLDALMQQGRTRPGMRSVPADLSGVRSLIKILRQKGAIGILPDQAPGAGEGKWLPFFGRPAYTMTLAARLSETGAALVFVRAERLAFGRGYRLHFSLPAAPIEGDTLARAGCINREVERLIRECPGQYLWSYNRYKQPAGAEPPPTGSDAGGAGNAAEAG